MMIPAHTVISTPAERAAMLPAPVVGVRITIPLDVWPEYLKLHHLEPAKSKGWGAEWVVKCKRVAEAA